MKIKANAKDSSGNLILNGSTGKPEVYYVWDVLDKRDNKPIDFKKDNLTYLSTFNHNLEMFAKLPGSFAYKSNSTSTGVTDKDSELVSHEMVIQVLEELGTVNFKFNNDIYPFEFTEISSNNLKVQFGEGRYYFPDLVGRFKKRADNPFHDKWGGKVSIEVTVTHKCEALKLVEFKEHNMAIIEVNVPDSIRFFLEKKGAKKNRKSSYKPEHLKSYYEYLHGKLSDQVYASVLSNPVSDKYHDRIVNTLKIKHKDLENLYEDSTAKLDGITNDKNYYKQATSDLKLEIKDIKKSIVVQLSKELGTGKESEKKRIRALGFWELISFWRSKD
jgi:hypothetical protein